MATRTTKRTTRPVAAPTSGQTVVTFKADADLVALLSQVRNRSEYIRAAILAAAGDICPVCNGSGVLSDNRRRHWDEFLGSHHLTECGTCHEQVPACHGKSVRAACTR